MLVLLVAIIGYILVSLKRAFEISIPSENTLPMIKVALIVALAAFTLSFPVTAQPAPSLGVSSSGPTLHLKGGLWFDGTKFVAANWYVVAGRFTRKAPSRVDATVNLKSRFIIPPLAEAHNHDLQNAWNAGRNAAQYIARGIFYTTQLCAMASDSKDFRGFLGSAAAPDVLFADSCLSASDGHPLGIALNGAKQAGISMTADDLRDKHYWVVDTLADLDAKWRKIAETKPALLKVILIDSPNYAANRQMPKLYGYNGMDPMLVPDVVRRARAIGARVAAHVDTGPDFTNAVIGGVDIVGHLPGYRIAAGKTAADYRLSDAAIAEAARRGVQVITTTAASRYDIARNPEHAAAIRATYADNISRLRAAGVTLLLGSDVYDGSVLDEIENVDTLKIMSRADLLRVATMTTPQKLFPDRDVGRFAEGAEGSLVALATNPLVDLLSLRRPVLLIKRGTIIGPQP
jgi:hypothetical protein